MADIITYPEDGIEYDSDDASGYLATRTSGVYSAEEDFAVTPGGGLTVSVSAGHAWVRPDRWKGRSIQMTQPEQLVLTDADPTRTRIDRIVLRYDAANRRTRLLVLEGTPDSDSPTAPEISRTALLYDLCLAEIHRTAGSTAVTSADITDTRLDETVCGLMRDGVTGIPTETLLAQYTAILTAMQQSGNAQLRQLAESIKAVDSGSFYTKAQADAKFGTPYTLTKEAIAEVLGFTPTKITVGTEDLIPGVSKLESGTVYLVYSTASAASSDEVISDTDIHLPEPEGPVPDEEVVAP